MTAHAHPTAWVGTREGSHDAGHAREAPVDEPRFLVRGLVVSSLATAAASFLLYSNLLVQLARGGMIPTAVAAIVPGLLFFAVLHRVVIRREPLVVDRTLLIMLAFLGVLLLSAFWARGYAEAVERITVFVTEGLATYFLVRNAVSDLPDLRVAVVGLICASVLLSALALLQAVTGNYEQDFMGLAQRSLEHLDGGPVTAATVGSEMRLEDRAYGPVGDPNRFAQILLMVLPLALVLGLNAKRRLGRWTAMLSVAAILGAVLVTYSRGGFLTLAVLVPLALAYRIVRPGRLILVGVFAVALAPVVAPGYVGRMVSIAGVAELWGNRQVEADGATRGRTTEMLAALAAFTDHAVLGVGPGQYLPFYSVEYQALPDISIRELAEPRRAHSLYLELGAELGTVGLLVFLAIPILLLRDLRMLRLDLQETRPQMARLAGAFSLLIVAYLGTGVFLHLAFERYYWFMMGLTAAAAGILDRRAREPMPDPVEPTAWVHHPPTTI